MKNKKVSLIYDIDFIKSYLSKDISLVPIYIGILKKMKIDLVFFKNENNKKININMQDVKVVKLKRYNFGVLNFIKNLKILKYIIDNAKKIEILTLFYLKITSFWYIFLYKLLNKKGKVYIKLDISENSLKNFNEFYNRKYFSFIDFINRFKIKYIIKNADILSVENSIIYKKLLNGNLKKLLKDKLIYIPNGFDDLNIYKYDYSYNNKENIIITVGRIGIFEKNSEYLLEIIKKLHLKDWKFYVIGPIEEKFEKKVKKFFINNPEFKNKVIFTGAIEDKNKLYQLYKKSKLFVLTSIIEASPIVFTEALYFGNYIITSDVGTSRDIILNANIGKIIDLKNQNIFVHEIQKIIDKKKIINSDYIKKYSKDNFVWSKIIKNLVERL